MLNVHPRLGSAEWLDRVPADPERVTTRHLEALTAALAGRPDVWRPLVRHDPVNRWYQLLLLTDAVEAWLIGWTPGQATEPHDHGGAAGALTVAEGALAEEVFDGPAVAATLDHAAGTSVRFGPGHLHRVGNRGRLNATSIHAYSPPNRPMRRYVRSAAGWAPTVEAAR